MCRKGGWNITKKYRRRHVNLSLFLFSVNTDACNTLMTQASIYPIQVHASCQYVAATIPPYAASQSCSTQQYVAARKRIDGEDTTEDSSSEVLPYAASQSCSTQQYVADRIRFNGEDSEDSSSSEGNDNNLIEQCRSVIKKKKPVKRLSVKSVLTGFLGDCKSMAIVVDD